MKKRDSSGFTLIELLVVIVLMSILAGALLSLQFILSQNQVTVWRSYISVNEANSNVASLVREVRTARFGDNGAYPLGTAEDNELVFYSDIDFDGATERVRYFLVGTDISKGVTDPTSFPVSYPPGDEKIKVISENVRNLANPVFYYYNGDWPEDSVNNPLSTPASPSDIKLIRVNLRLNPNADEADKDYVLESYTQIRMLKENL